MSTIRTLAELVARMDALLKGNPKLVERMEQLEKLEEEGGVVEVKDAAWSQEAEDDYRYRHSS